MLKNQVLGPLISEWSERGLRHACDYLHIKVLIDSELH